MAISNAYGMMRDGDVSRWTLIYYAERLCIRGDDIRRPIMTIMSPLCHLLAWVLKMLISDLPGTYRIITALVEPGGRLVGAQFLGRTSHQDDVSAWTTRLPLNQASSVSLSSPWTPRKSVSLDGRMCTYD